MFKMDIPDDVIQCSGPVVQYTTRCKTANVNLVSRTLNGLECNRIHVRVCSFLRSTATFFRVGDRRATDSSEVTSDKTRRRRFRRKASPLAKHLTKAL